MILPRIEPEDIKEWMKEKEVKELSHSEKSYNSEEFLSDSESISLLSEVGNMKTTLNR